MSEPDKLFVVCSPIDEAPLRGNEPGFDTPCEECTQMIFVCDDTLTHVTSLGKPSEFLCSDCSFARIAALPEDERPVFIPPSTAQLASILRHFMEKR